MIKRKTFFNAMNSKGYTPQSLSKALGVSKWLVYKWLYGNSEPNVERLLELMSLLEVSAEDILRMFIEEREEEENVDD